MKQTRKAGSRRHTAAVQPKMFKPRSFFKREAEWMWMMNLAPFGIGLLLALVFWFTR